MSSRARRDAAACKLGSDSAQRPVRLALLLPHSPTSMPLRFPSLQRRRLLFNFAIVLFLVFFAVAVLVSISCKFQTPCASSGVIDDGWSSLWGLKSPNERGPFSIDDRRENAVIEDEEDVIGPAYCPVCGTGDALCAKYGYVIHLSYIV